MKPGRAEKAGTTGASAPAAPAPDAPAPKAAPRDPAPARFRLRDPDTVVDRYLIPLALFVAAFLVFAFVNHGRPANLNYFVPLADAFLHGRLGLTSAPSWLNELVPSGTGLYYVVYPPAPTVLVLPFVIVFGPEVNQAWPSILFGALGIAVASVVIRYTGVDRRTRIILAATVAFGTIAWFSAQAGSSWHFAHVAATLFMLTAIVLAQKDARPALIGLAFAAAAMSRLPVAMAAPFFIAYFIDRDIRESTGDRTPFGWLGQDRPRIWNTRPDLRSTFLLALPALVEVGVILILYGIYNAARFGSPFENGYALIPGLLQENQYEHGFFAILNIPRILFAMLLSVPEQVAGFPWIQSRKLGGLSIILTTPLFLWAIKARRPDWFGIGAWVSIGLILVPILTHSDPGGAQFGFRYAQDLYPLLLLLVIRGLRGRISFEAWIAIGIGWVINIWGMASTYADWWK